MKTADPAEGERFQKELEALFRENHRLIYRAAYRVLRTSKMRKMFSRACL